MKVEWEARWSGGMHETAILTRPAEGVIIPQGEFARHSRHVSGGSELYRADVEESEIVLHLYISGSGRTQTVRMIHGPAAWKSPDFPRWDSFDEAEQALGLPEGSIGQAFMGHGLVPHEADADCAPA